MIRLRAFGPAMTAPTPRDAVLAALGAAFGLLACDLLLFVLSPGNVLSHLLLVAPFGATAFLVFVLPNSPLAQPWSAVVGNTVSALAALAVLIVTDQPLFAAPLAVALAILLMAVFRAFHPPAGATALATILAAPQPGFPGLSFAFLPVCIGTVVLVAIGVVWNRATGRIYPFRQPAPAPHATDDSAPDRRLGLLPTELAHLLDRLRMAPNIGVEDLARVLGAAGNAAAARHMGELTAADIMSRDIVTVADGSNPAQVAALFRKHRFKTLPMTDAEGRYAGLIDQSALLGLIDRAAPPADLAVTVATLPPDAGIAAVMDVLADGHQQAVPIIRSEQLVGLITRSDLIALLSARLRDGWTA